MFRNAHTQFLLVVGYDRLYKTGFVRVHRNSAFKLRKSSKPGMTEILVCKRHRTFSYLVSLCLTNKNFDLSPALMYHALEKCPLSDRVKRAVYHLLFLIRENGRIN